MFTDLNEYYKDKDDYLKEVVSLEISNGEIDEETKAKQDKEKDKLKDKFKDKIRKYIPTCLNHINTMFNIKYSIYKVGKDFDSSFNVIETNVKKTKEDIINELNYYLSITTNDAESIEKLKLVMDILTTYVDDKIDEEKERTLNNSTIVNSSIITNVPVMQMKENNMDDPSTQFNYNPYAGQAYGVESGISNTIDNSNSMQNNDTSGMSIFGNNSGLMSNDTSNVDPNLINNYSSGTMDIFGVNNKE